MSFLFDPNVAFLLLAVGFVLTVLAIFTPGTGLLEIGALFAIVLAGYAIYHLVINWWALLLIVVSIVPFYLSTRKAKQWKWLIPSLLLLSVGSVFLFQQSLTQQSTNPFFAIFTSVLVTLLLWLIGRRSIEALKMKPSQDLKRLIGQIGEAKTDIKNSGTVYVGGEQWTARSDKLIASGSLVKVLEREGLVLLVESAKRNDK
jgi:membrane-bound ClpP family serine protease